MKSCCFTGHRLLPRDQAYYQLREETRDAILRAIKLGCKRFIAGGAAGYDMMCERMVLGLKQEYPDITLSVYVPFEGQADGFGIKVKELYHNLLNAADEVRVLAPHFYKGCLHERNRRMVEDSAMVIAYMTDTRSGTGYTVEYAKKLNKPIYFVGRYLKPTY
ncbi:MAG: SLOG family protein [Clostridia bacterium]|nr:SLOG family protein [Clostridia bacterium]